MRSTLNDIIERIPDFDEFVALADKIRDVSLEKLLLEKDIKSKESEVFRTATFDEKYFVNGKPPAISFIENAYKQDGFDVELVDVKKKLAELTAESDHLKLTMSIYKDMLSVFQTLSANERGHTF